MGTRAWARSVASSSTARSVLTRSAFALRWMVVVHYRPTDDEGRTDESGWEIHLLANKTYTASVRLCCDSPTAQVTLSVSGTELALTDPDGDSVYEGVITTPVTGTTAVTSTLSVSCNGMTSEAQSQVLIDPDGVVYDIDTGAPLSGAQVMCMAKGEAAPRAPATACGLRRTSANSTRRRRRPMATSASLPRGPVSAGCGARAAISRIAHRTCKWCLRRCATMCRSRRSRAESPKVTIAIDENGFEPAIVKVAPGTVIAFVNADVREHA